MFNLKEFLEVKYWKNSKYFIINETIDSIIFKMSEGKILYKDSSYGDTYSGYNIDKTFYLKIEDNIKKITIYSESEYYPIERREYILTLDELKDDINKFFFKFSINLFWEDKIPERF